MTMRLIVLACLAVFVPKQSCAEVPSASIEIEGTVISIGARPDGTPFFSLRYVSGPIPGRISQTQVQVDLCASPGNCLDFDPAELKKGMRVRVKGNQKNDYFLKPALSVVPVALLPVESAANSLFGTVTKIYPAAGGWQWLEVVDKDGKKLMVQTCADYNKAAVCPAVAGNIKEIGAYISYSGIKLDDNHYWKLEGISRISSARLVLSPETLDFGDTKVGNPKRLAVKLTNVGDIAASARLVTPNTAPWSVDFSSCGALAPGAACEFVVSFSPAREGASQIELELEYTKTVCGASVCGTGPVREKLAAKGVGIK